MKTNLLPGLAVVALLLCSFSAWKTWEVGREIARANSQNEMQPYLSLLEQRMKELKERQESLFGVLNRTDGGNATTRAEANPELEARIEELSLRVSSLREEMLNGAYEEDVPLEGTNEGTKAYLEDALAEFRSRALDVTRSPGERVSALEVLRRYPGAMDTDVVGSMLALLQDPSSSASIRRHVVRNLHGIEDGRLRDAFLVLLRSDPDPKVRAEAAESLENFMDEAHVRDGLLLTSEHDPSEEVRSEAEAALARDP